MNLLKTLGRVALVLVAIVALLIVRGPVEAAIGASLLGVGMTFLRRDALLEATKALPNGAATTVTAGIDLDLTSRSDFLVDCALEIEAPALDAADLPDAKTMIYDVYHDSDSAFGTEVKLFSAFITQTGADSSGAAAVTEAVKLPADVKRYLRAKATGSDTGDASDKSFTARLRF